MRKHNKITALLLALALAVTPGAAGIPGQEGGRVSAEENATTFQNLNQEEIVEAMGAGWNLGNQLEANMNGIPQEDAWTGVKITERLIRTVKTKGFKSIRIPVSYLSKIGAAPNYTINKTWLNRVQEVVDWAIKYKLYVVMNVHGDGYSTVTGGWLLPGSKTNQDVIKPKYEAVWKQIADRFKDYDQYLIFESMNEVGAEITEMKDGDAKTTAIAEAYENINAYNQIFVDTVRQSGGNNDKRWLLVPGMNTNIDYTAGDYGFQIPQDTHLSAEVPEGQKRLMVSVHYYDPWAFCGQEDYKTTQWGEDADQYKRASYGQEDDMQKQFAKLKNSFTSKGYPVVIGEYGSIDKTKKNDSGLQKYGEPDPDNNKFRAYYAKTLCTYAIRNGCVPVYWDNGWNGDLGFGLIDRTTYEVTQPEILNAIISAYSQKEGTATAISLDKNILDINLVDDKQSLQATLTPADSEDTILWSSSDENVASVSFKGKVTAKGIGTCIITATVPGGASAYCLVRVKDVKSFKGGLYAQTAADWSMIEGDNYTDITQDGGGTFTISLSGTKDQMNKLNLLYIKDVTVERGIAETSILNNAEFKVDSLEFNGHECEMYTNEFSYIEGDEYKDDILTGKRTVPDICMLNYWYDPANCIKDLKKNAEKETGCSFPEDWYVDDINTLTMQVIITDAVLKKDYGKPDDTAATDLKLSRESVAVLPGNTVALTATVTPDTATEKVLWFSENTKIAEVAQDGTVTAVKNGETTIHALTISGKDVSCKVTVDENAVTEPEPTTVPSTEPSAEPSAEPSSSPSHQPDNTSTPEPSTVPSASPSTAPSAGPSTAPSTSPSVKPSDAPVPNQVTVFTAGKLKYRVTGTANGKASASVCGPVNKKAKSLTIPATVKKSGTTCTVTALDANAFKNCKKLKKITIGKNVTSIGKNAFSGDKALKKIKVKSTKLKKIGKNALKGIHKKAVIKVPKKKLKKYRKLWKKKGQKKSVKIK